MRSEDYMRGFRHASRLAVAYLHREADAMNDPVARKCWNSAAFGLGSEMRMVTAKMVAGDDPRDDTAKV